MANAFSRSWRITKLSFGVIKKDKEILLYPLFSTIFSIAFLIAMLFPTIIVNYIGENSQGYVWDWVGYLLVFLTYLGMAVINTFFNVCIVYTAKTRFEGGNATVGSSFKFAFKKFHLIFLWGILQATVGLLLNVLQSAANNRGGRAARVGAKVAETAWKITTIFVIPAMVYYDLKPFKAIKKSVQTLKKTWGESLIRYFGLGLIEFLFILLGIVVTIGLGYLLIPLGGTGLIALIVLAALYFIGVALSFTAANQVFNTALFVYADKGKVPSEFDKEVIKNAFTSRAAAVKA